MTRLATPADVPHLVEALRAADRVAIDTEFHAERRYVPALFLVQLRLPDGETWLVDPLVEGLLASLAEPLRSTDWVLHGGHWDMRVLHVALGGLPDRILDTQIGAGLIQPWFPLGYASLTEEVLQHPVDKSETLSDWSRRPLTEQQLRYAADDVALLFELWDAIAERLDTRGRRDLAEAACAEARQEVVEPPPPDEAWRSIRGRNALSGEQLAVLQEVAAWRRERAIAQNQPERSVLSDGALLELAKRRPLTRQALTSNRRLPRSLQKSAGELLERIGRAAQRPEWGWPRAARRRSDEGLQMAWLEVWASTLGVAQSFAGSLVLPERVREDVVLAHSQEAALAALSPWRRELAGDHLRRALEGRSRLGLRDGAPRIV